MTKIGIVVVCTNAYFILAIRFVKNFMHYYKGEHEIIFFLFTDTNPAPYIPNIKHVYINKVHKKWIDGTNSKFQNILEMRKYDVDYIFYFDADTDVTESFTEEWFIGDLVGGEHYNNRWDQEKPYDRHPKSKAYVSRQTKLPQTYYYGAFFGGRKQLMMNFCDTLHKNQLTDKKIHYEPAWNDESYINNYFHFNPPTRVVLSDAFMFSVSTKAGIENMRDPDLSIEKQKHVMLRNPNSRFNIKNGNVTVINE